MWAAARQPRSTKGDGTQDFPPAAVAIVVETQAILSEIAPNTRWASTTTALSVVSQLHSVDNAALPGMVADMRSEMEGAASSSKAAVEQLAKTVESQLIAGKKDRDYNKVSALALECHNTGPS